MVVLSHVTQARKCDSSKKNDSTRSSDSTRIGNLSYLEVSVAAVGGGAGDAAGEKGSHEGPPVISGMVGIRDDRCVKQKQYRVRLQI